MPRTARASRHVALCLYAGLLGACVDEAGPVAPHAEHGATHHAHGPDGDVGRLDRHALHAGPESKGVDPRELESAVRALMVIGEREAEPYRSLFVELADVGTDAAARTVLELHADARMQFTDRDAVVAAALRILLDRPAVDATRAELEALLDVLDG